MLTSISIVVLVLTTGMETARSVVRAPPANVVVVNSTTPSDHSLLLHELAHAWEATSMDDETRAEVLAFW